MKIALVRRTDCFRRGTSFVQLLLEWDDYVDAALFGVGIAFPPPAPGSDVFTGLDGSGAGCASE